MKNIILFLMLFFSFILGYAQYNDKDIYNYIEQYKELAIRKMHEYKIPASITLAQGIFESACGTSVLATEGKNHFGIKCHKDWEGDSIHIDDDTLAECFRKYEQVEDSYDDHSLFLISRPRYSELFLLNIMDYKAWAKGLKEAGYATNPQYAERLIKLIEKYQIAKQDSGYYQGMLTMPATEQVSDAPETTVQEKPTPEAEKPQEAIMPPKPEKPTVQVKVPEKQETPQIQPIVEMKVFTAQKNQFQKVSYPFSERIVYENNRTYFVIAEASDTFLKIAEDLQDKEKNIRRFNDASDKEEPIAGQVIYIEIKGKNGPSDPHTIAAGETLKYIAQLYGVQLYYIFQYNNLNESSVIHPGNQIKLKP